MKNGYRVSWIFVGVVITCLLSQSSWADARKAVTRAVLERVFGRHDTQRMILNSGKWIDDLDRAIHAVRRETGREAKAMTDYLAASIRLELKDPKHLERIILDLKLKSSLRNGWREILSRYIFSTQTLLGGFERQFEVWARTETAYLYLERYYYDEVQKSLAVILKERARFPKRFASERIDSALKYCHAFFNSKTGQTIFGASAVERDQALAGLKASAQELDKQLAYIKGQLQLPNVGKVGYLDDLKNIIGHVDRYVKMVEHSVIDDSSRVIGHDLIKSLGLRSDFFLAQVRYGKVEQKKWAFNLLRSEYSAGMGHLSEDVILEVLSQPSPEFRRFVLSHFTQPSKYHRVVVSFDNGTAVIVRENEVTVVLEALYMKSLTVVPGSPAFKDVAQGMTAVLMAKGNPKLMLESLNRAASVAKQQSIIRAMSLLDTKEAFAELVKVRFFTEATKNIEVFKVWINSLVDMLARTDTFDARCTALRKLFVSMINKKVPLEMAFQVKVVEGMGGVLKISGYDKDFVNFLKIAAARTVSHYQLRAQAIFSLAKLGYMDDVAKQMFPLLSYANAEVRAAAIIYLSFSHRSKDFMILQINNLLRLPANEVSERSLLALLDIIPSAAVLRLRPSLLRCAEMHPSFRVRLRSLLVLAKNRYRAALEPLWKLFEYGTVAEQLQVLRVILVSYPQDRVTMKLVVEKIITILKEKPHVDLWSHIDYQTLTRGMKAFSGPKLDILPTLGSTLKSQNKKIREFGRVALDALH